MIARYPFAAVLFDLDGVVIDNTPLHQFVWREFARSHGLNPSEDDIQAANGRRAVDVVVSLFGDGLNQEEVLQLAAARGVLYRQHLASADIQAVSGVESFLEKLGSLGVPRIVATSTRRDNAALVLNRLELSSCFESIVAAEDVRNGKPDPEVYFTAALRASVNPEECLVIEDAIPGVLAAKASGASCLGMTTSQSEESLKQAGADWVAPHFLSLPDQL